MEGTCLGRWRASGSRSSARCPTLGAAPSRVGHRQWGTQQFGVPGPWPDRLPHFRLALHSEQRLLVAAPSTSWPAPMPLTRLGRSTLCRPYGWAAAEDQRGVHGGSLDGTLVQWSYGKRGTLAGGLPRDPRPGAGDGLSAGTGAGVSDEARVSARTRVGPMATPAATILCSREAGWTTSPACLSRHRPGLHVSQRVPPTP